MLRCEGLLWRMRARPCGGGAPQIVLAIRGWRLEARQRSPAEARRASCLLAERFGCFGATGRASAR